MKTANAKGLGKVTDSTCDFCNELGLTRYMDKIKTNWGYEYQAALARRWWEKAKGKRSARITLHIKSRRSQMGFKLNFCPECGKDLRKHKNSHAEDIRELMTKEEITEEDLQGVIDKWKREKDGCKDNERERF